MWQNEQILTVAGDSFLHFININSWSKVGSSRVINLSESNKHISCFGGNVSFCDINHDIIVCQRDGDVIEVKLKQIFKIENEQENKRCKRYYS